MFRLVALVIGIFYLLTCSISVLVLANLNLSQVHYNRPVLPLSFCRIPKFLGQKFPRWH